MKRRQFIFAAVAALGLAWAAATPATAATPITLTDDLKREISALKPLRGTGINNTAFDGRPVLVTFFASW